MSHIEYVVSKLEHLLTRSVCTERKQIVDQVSNDLNSLVITCNSTLAYYCTCISSSVKPTLSVFLVNSMIPKSHKIQPTLRKALEIIYITKNKLRIRYCVEFKNIYMETPLEQFESYCRCM